MISGTILFIFLNFDSIMSRDMRKISPVMEWWGSFDLSDTNRPIQSQKARGTKRRGIVLSLKQNKCTDELCSNCTADCIAYAKTGFLLTQMLFFKQILDSGW